MQGCAKRHLRGLEACRERTGHETLHVRRAAPIELAVARGHREWRQRPVLAVDGNDVGVAGQHDTGLVSGADGGKEVGLVPVRAVDDLAGNAVRSERIRSIADEVEVRVAAHRREGDQPVEDPDAVHVSCPFAATGCLHRVTAALKSHLAQPRFIGD